MGERKVLFGLVWCFETGLVCVALAVLEPLCRPGCGQATFIPPFHPDLFSSLSFSLLSPFFSFFTDLGWNQALSMLDKHYTAETPTAPGGAHNLGWQSSTLSSLCHWRCTRHKGERFPVLISIKVHKVTLQSIIHHLLDPWLFFHIWIYQMHSPIYSPT